MLFQEREREREDAYQPFVIASSTSTPFPINIPDGSFCCLVEVPKQKLSHKSGPFKCLNTVSSHKAEKSHRNTGLRQRGRKSPKEREQASKHLRGISSGSFGLTTNPSIVVELTGAVTRTRITTGRRMMKSSKLQTAAAGGAACDCRVGEVHCRD